MPAILSTLQFQGGSRLRGLLPPVAPDEPLRKGDGAGGSGHLTWFPFTAGTTLIIDHSENGLTFDSATAVNLVVPTNANVPFPIGTSVLIEQAGAGVVNFVGQSAGGDTVMIDVRAAFLKTTAGQYAPATLVKKAANRWLLSGDLVPA